ncbi:MAG: peptide/nickel transport system permease protein [Chloroflexota bacterium]|nr:peptide/nickel transport system permease protein [Chloroflexota bacterium]
MREFWRRFSADRGALVGLAIVTVIVLVALLAPLIAPYDPTAQALELRRAGPSSAHPFGMDELGRDILSRLMYGAGNTLTAGLLTVSIGIVIGVPLGLIAGYYGGLLEAITMRAMDAMLAFPAFILAIVIVAVLEPSLQNAAIAIGISQIPSFTRLVRASTLAARHQDYVLGAVSVGSRSRRIIARHVLPNVLPPIVVFTTISLASSILSVAGLSFLGLGAQPPASEWGLMLRSGREYIREAPQMTIVPGVAIMLVVLAFNLVGDGLRDSLDARLRRS